MLDFLVEQQRVICHINKEEGVKNTADIFGEHEKL